MANRLRIEGLAPDEILALSDGELDALVFCDEPLAFRIGSADVLGSFHRTPTRLTVELAQIDGGGEGVLPTLAALARRYALRVDTAEREWIVHAVDCAKPNPKLRSVLERRGLRIEDVPDAGRCYRLVEVVRTAGGQTLAPGRDTHLPSSRAHGIEPRL